LHEYVDAHPEVGLILVSCGAGEFSMPLEEEGATAFAFYLDEGLKGAADAFPNGPRDKWVKVRELASYVTDRVSRWAYNARGALQKPYLIGDRNLDFRLTVHMQAYESEPAEVKPLVYPKWLAEGWVLRDQWASLGAWTLAPNLIRQLEDQLLRTESRFRAGGADEILKTDWINERDKLTRSWDKSKSITPPSKITVLGVKPPPGLEAGVDRWLASPEPRKKLTDDLGDLKLKPEELIYVLWKKAGNTPQRRDVVALLCGAAVPPGPTPPFAEAVFFEKLKELSAKRVFTAGERVWPAEAVHAAVRSEQAWLEALDQLRPEGFGWFRTRLEDLGKRKNEVEATLWTLGDDALGSAATVTMRVFGMYQQIGQELEIVRDEARKAALADDAVTAGRAELPGFALWVTRLDPSQRGDAKEQWRTGIDAATAIANEFDAAQSGGRFNGDLLISQSTKLNDAMFALRNQVALQLKRDPDGRTTPPILAMPRVSAKEREEYWGRWHNWCAGKHKLVRENEVNMVGETAPSSNPPVEGDRPSLRGRVAIDLGRLSAQPVSPLIEEWTRLNESIDPAAWDGFGPKLLPLFSSPADAVDAVTIRIGGVFGTTNAPAIAAARHRYDLWRWLADRYDGDARARNMVRATFYTEAGPKARAAADIALKAAGQ
jgi:hypothetical protein